MPQCAHRILVAALMCGAVPAVSGGQVQQSAARLGVTPARLLAPRPGEWLNHGREYNNQRFSPLAQINTRTVSRLTPAWLFQVPVPQGGGLEATPIVADGVMYVTTAFNSLYAFDLRTRQQLWRYEHKRGTSHYCCGPVNRGAAMANGLVFMATLDARLVALDAKTGKVRWNIETNSPDSGYSLTMAPLVVDDKVIVGAAGGEYGIRGSVSAYDVTTGVMVWRWYTIPSPEEGGWWGHWSARTPTGEDLRRDLAKEHADSATYADAWRRGGAPVWTTPAYDAELGTIFFGVGNPSPSNDGGVRPGDNLYNNSTVALDARTGKLRWHYQHVPHDRWDYDIPNPPIVARIGGRALLLHATKTGWLYVFDAATGSLVRRSEPFVPQKGMFFEPTKEGISVAPGFFGGANWPPSAYSPATGFAYVAGTHFPMIVTREPSEYKAGSLYVSGDARADTTEKLYSQLSAISPTTGRIVWQTKSDGFLWGGALATAGGLVFAGESTGWLRAFDAATGKQMWEFFCGAGVGAPPISFEMDGQQYVAVAAGGSRYERLYGSTVLVFGLGTEGGRVTTASISPSAGQQASRDRPRHTETLPAGFVSGGPYLAYDSAHKAVRVVLSAVAGRNRGFNFNGGFEGNQTVTVPVGWRVQMHVSNDDQLPHSALVVRDAKPFPATLDNPAIPRAVTTHLIDGFGTGEQDDVEFVAAAPGAYLIACAVPGHAASGMYIRFVVSSTVAKPSYR
jgi:alcohol dehydrogenase (cytochrome c)